MKRIARVMLAATMLVAVGVQFGCGEWTAEDKAFVKDLTQEWLRSKNMSPTDENGEVDLMGSVRFAQAAVGRSDDEDANSVLGIYTSVSGVIAADKAMDEARASGDAARMDEVIADRPHDYSYRSSRAALALAQGDMNTYEQQTAEFARLAAERQVPETQQARRVIADYEGVAVPDTGAQCTAKYAQLSKAYEALYADTQDSKWGELAMAAAVQMTACE